MTSSAEYKNLESKYYMQVVNRMPPVLVRGEGTRVFDNDGNSYLDFTATLQSLMRFVIKRAKSYRCQTCSIRPHNYHSQK